MYALSIKKKKPTRFAVTIASIVKTIGLANPYARQSKTQQPIKRGHIAMYVGDEAKRYEVPVEYLNLPPFQELIRGCHDGELEIKIDGPIEIRCTPARFEQVLIDCAKGLEQLPNASEN